MTTEVVWLNLSAQAQAAALGQPRPVVKVTTRVERRRDQRGRVTFHVFTTSPTRARAIVSVQRRTT